jgi:hypothetical protein
MNKNVVVTMRIISAVLLLPIGLKILSVLTKIFPDFKTMPWVVTSLLLFLTLTLVSPILTIVSAVKADVSTGRKWGWAAFGIGLFAPFLPLLGNFVQFHRWSINELKVDFGLLATNPKIFQYLFIVRNVGLVVLLVSLLVPAKSSAKRAR